MKIKVTNNWESLYWEIDGTDVTAALSKVTLQFPDKSEDTYKVTWKRHTETYSDMGHDGYAQQYNAFIKLRVNGMLLETNLLDIAKRVKVLQYKVRRP